MVIAHSDTGTENDVSPFTMRTPWWQVVAYLEPEGRWYFRLYDGEGNPVRPGPAGGHRCLADAVRVAMTYAAAMELRSHAA